jgi:hypothetical protein
VQILPEAVNQPELLPVVKSDIVGLKLNFPGNPFGEENLE